MLSRWIKSPFPLRRRVVVEDAGDVKIVRFLDRRVLDGGSIEWFDNSVYPLIDECGRQLLLDMGDVEFWSSALLGKLITAHRGLQVVNGRMAVCRACPGVASVCRLTMLDRVVTFISAPEQADDVWRAVIGRLLDPASFSPEWRTDTAMTLARQAWQTGELGALPILADALQDAGCTHDDVLTVCRSNAACVRRVWALELILRNEFEPQK
jgi:anti-sigma B factor antagonist